MCGVQLIVCHQCTDAGQRCGVQLEEEGEAKRGEEGVAEEWCSGLCVS